MKRTLSSIAAAALVLGTLAPAAFADTTTGTYTDVTAGSYGASAINALTADGYIHGYSNGTYQPTYIVSRGQLLAYFMNAVESVTGVKPVANAQYYADVAPGNWAFNYVGAAQENSWLNQYWLNIRPGYNFNENYQASLGDAASFFVAAMESAGKLTSADLNGMSPLAYAKSIGLFNGISTTENVLQKSASDTEPAAWQSVYMDRASAAIFLQNVLAWTQGQLLPSGVTPSVSGSTTVAPGSNEQLTVTAQNADGSTYTLPSTASVTWNVVSGGNNAFFNPNVSGQLVVSAAGSYQVTATVDGVTSAPFTVTAFGAAAGLTVKPAMATLPANGNSTDNVVVQVVDANGNPVSNYNGTVAVTDTAGMLWNSTTNAYTNNLGNVTVTNGQATVAVKAGVQVGLTDTITATDLTSNGVVLNTASGSAVSQTATITTVPQVATSLSISAATPVVENNVASSDVVSAQVLDQAGFPMLTGTYPVTFSVSGQGLINGGTTNVTGVYVGNGDAAAPSSVPVTAWSEQGVTGSITVTAASAGLNSVSTSIKSVVVGSPVALQLGAPSGSVASGSSTTLSTAVVDQNGYPTSLPAGDTITATVTQNGAATTGATATYGNGEVTFTGTTAGTYTVTLSDSLGLLKSATQNVTVTAGTASQVMLGASSVYVPDYNSNTTISAQLQDAAGNNVAEAGVPVTFTVYGTSGQTATFNGVSVTNGQTVTIDTNAQGAASATFTAPPTSAQGTTWTVDAAIAGSKAASESIVQEFGTANKVTVDLQDTKAQSASFQGGTVYAQGGDTVTGTVYVTNQYGAPVTTLDTLGITLPSNLTPTGGINTTNDTMTLNGSGYATFTAQATTAGAANVQVTDESVQPNVSGSASMTIIPGQASGAALFQNGALVTSGVVVAANTPVAFTVESVDAGGNPVVSSYPMTVNLSDGSNGGQFRTSETGAAVSSVTIPAGQSSVVVYYVNGTASSSTGYTFSVAPAGSIAVAPASTSVANSGTDAVNATVKDSSGNLLSNATVYYTVTGGGTLSAASTTTGSNGVASVSYMAPATGSGTATVTATTYKGNVAVTNTTTISY